METLDSELKATDAPPPELKIAYEPPGATALQRLEEGVGFEMDSDSEDDIDEFGGLYERCGDEGPPRFELLKDLWGKKVAVGVGSRR